MRTRWIGGLAALGMAAFATPAIGQETRVRIEEERRPVAEIGVQAGFPSGISAKVWTSERVAVQTALAVRPDDGAAMSTIDVLLHTRDLTDEPGVRVPLYLGAGARVTGLREGESTSLGVRAPIGMTAIFDGAPVSVFAEVAPAWVAGQNRTAGLDADAALGARLVF